MGTYRVTTDQGTYDVETDDGASASPVTSSPNPSPTISTPTPVNTRQDRFTLKSSQPYSNYSYGDAMMDSGKTAINSLANLGQGFINPIMHPLQTIGGIANSVMHPIDTAKAAAGYINSRYGSMDKIADTVAQDPFGFGADVVGGASIAKGIGSLGTKIPSLKPTIYNDQLISDTAKSAISKIKNKVEPIRDLYKSVTEPYKNQIVDSETFQKALNSVPPEIKQDFVDTYGTKILDSTGKPQTTVGNLHKMELELKDFIQQPKFGGKISAADYNVAEAAKNLKNLRLAQLPEEAQSTIKALDKQFGPAINASNTFLPKLADKNGMINTKYLFNTFKNPADAGVRQHLADLKNIGIDLEPELKTVKGWVKRQGAKNFAKGTIQKGIESAILGGVLRGGH